MSDRSLHQSLEAELAANPDDQATHAAYADLLSEEGDARGEFIQVQLALEDQTLEPNERLRLRQREEELLHSYARRWLEGLEAWLAPGDVWTFRRGWLDTLDLGRISLPLARALRDHPHARLLGELTIRSAKHETTQIHPDDGVPEGDEAPGFWPLVGSPALANVRVFRLGEDDGDDYHEYQYRCTLQTAAVPLLLRSMPLLEEAYLFANGYDLTAVFALPTLTHLRVLQVHHCPQVYRLDILANNPALHRLTHLLCHPHALGWVLPECAEDDAAGFREADGYLPLSVVRPLLHSPHLPRLTHLRLRVSSMGDDGCAEIVRSGILRRLKVLDLRHGRITDAGAEMLARCPDIRHLELLDLGSNSLSSALMEGLGPDVLVGDQHPVTSAPPTPEDEYLGEGEFE